MNGNAPHRHVTIKELQRARHILKYEQVTEERTSFLLDIARRIDECDICYERERLFEVLLPVFGNDYSEETSAAAVTETVSAETAEAPISFPSIDDLFDYAEQIVSTFGSEMRERCASALTTFEEWATGSRRIVGGFNLNWTAAAARSSSDDIAADEPGFENQGVLEFSIEEPSGFSVLFDESYLDKDATAPDDSAELVAVVCNKSTGSVDLLPISIEDGILSSPDITLAPGSYACWIAWGD